jgi:hypothetical protein
MNKLGTNRIVFAVLLSNRFCSLIITNTFLNIHRLYTVRTCEPAND